MPSRPVGCRPLLLGIWNMALEVPSTAVTLLFWSRISWAKPKR